MNLTSKRYSTLITHHLFPEFNAGGEERHLVGGAVGVGLDLRAVVFDEVLDRLLAQGLDLERALGAEVHRGGVLRHGELVVEGDADMAVALRLRADLHPAAFGLADARDDALD